MNNEINTDEIFYLKIAGHNVAVRHNSIAASLADNSASPSAPHVIFCGGFHSNMQGIKAQALAEFCTSHDWPYTRFDYRGHGDSEGAPHAFTMHDWLEDTLQVLNIYEHPVIIIGSSMGAWLATLAARQKPAQTKGLLLLAAAPDFLQELVEPILTPTQIWDLQQDQVVQLPNNYKTTFPLTKSLLESGKTLNLLKGAPISDLTCPIRLLHGTDDNDVPYELSIRLMDRITHDNAQLTLLHKADHRLSDEPSLERIKRDLAGLMAAAIQQGQY